MRKPARIWIPSLILVLLLGIAALVLRRQGISLSHANVLEFQAAVVELGFWGPLLYIGFCVVATLLLVPATPVLLVAGVFGVFLGSVYATIGLLLGAGASFLLARHLGRPFMQRWLHGNPALRRLDDGVRQEGWHMVLITRLVPAIPFCFQNYLYGLTGIGFFTYTAVTAACLIPPVIAYVFIGGSLMSGTGEIRKVALYLAIAGSVLALLSLTPRLFRKKWHLEEAADQPEDTKPAVPPA